VNYCTVRSRSATGSTSDAKPETETDKFKLQRLQARYARARVCGGGDGGTETGASYLFSGYGSSSFGAPL